MSFSHNPKCPCFPYNQKCGVDCPMCSCPEPKAAPEGEDEAFEEWWHVEGFYIERIRNAHGAMKLYEEKVKL